MSLDAIRTAIVGKLEQLPGIGRVHAYERYASTHDALRQIYLADDGQLRGWYVQRTGRAEQSPALGRWQVTQRWKIQGFMALADADASELRFDALVESACAAFRQDETLGGTVASTVTDAGAGLQVAQSGPVMFAGVLCHGATLTLATLHYL